MTGTRPEVFYIEGKFQRFVIVNGPWHRPRATKQVLPTEELSPGMSGERLQSLPSTRGWWLLPLASPACFPARPGGYAGGCAVRFSSSP